MSSKGRETVSVPKPGTGQGACARQPQQEGLGLIVDGVTDMERGDLVLDHPCTHQRIARLARGGFHAGFRLDAFPRQDMRFQSCFLRPGGNFPGVL
jgi:hypothetical protein